MISPVIVVHGGAWDIPNELVKGHLKGCREAALKGMEILKRGGKALDAVESSVNSMEDNDVFDAGVGSFLNAEGEVEMDAIIMDGGTLEFGAVAAVKNIKNPISLARAVMEKTEHVMLVGEGANKFAVKIGFKTCRTEDLIVRRELERFKEIKKKLKFETREVFTDEHLGTVGAVAMDLNGNLAAGTSTGGVPNKMPGRVGDTAIVGCGAYADNCSGAVSTTGWGESIMKVTLAKTTCMFLEKGFNAQEAAEKAVKHLEKRVGGYGGVIVVDSKGNIGLAYNTPRMAYAYIDGEGKLHLGV